MEYCQAIVRSTGRQCAYKAIPGLNTCGVHRAVVGITCTICLDEVSSKTGSKILKCGHVFHNKCVTEWFNAGKENSHCCATCRAPWRRPVPQLPKMYTVEPSEAMLEQMRGFMIIDQDFVNDMDPGVPEPIVLDGVFPDGGSLFIRMTLDNWRYLVA